MPLGLQQDVLRALDWSLALRRIHNDVQSDFIYSPHFSAVFLAAGDELKELVTAQLKSGRLQPRLPVRMEVPKLNGFPRPGAILWPVDRLTIRV